MRLAFFCTDNPRTQIWILCGFFCDRPRRALGQRPGARWWLRSILRLNFMDPRRPGAARACATLHCSRVRLSSDSERGPQPFTFEVMRAIFSSQPAPLFESPGSEPAGLSVPLASESAVLSPLLLATAIIALAVSGPMRRELTREVAHQLSASSAFGVPPTFFLKFLYREAEPR